MRATIHLVSARDYWPFEVAVAKARREMWLAAGRRAVETDAREMSALARRAAARMRGGELTRAEIQETTGDAMRTNGVGMWIDLVRVPPSGKWERGRADLYALAEDWLGPAGIDVEAARERLVSAYLTGFGPAAPAEIADWAGLKPPAVTRALNRLKAPALSQRGRRRARRPAAAALARSRDSRPAPLSPDLGREPASPLPARADPAGGLAAAGLQHEDAAVGPKRSCSTGRWPAAGATPRARCGSSRSASWRMRIGRRSTPRPSGSPSSTPRRAPARGRSTPAPSAFSSAARRTDRSPVRPGPPAARRRPETPRPARIWSRAPGSASRRDRAIAP